METQMSAYDTRPIRKVENRAERLSRLASMASGTTPVVAPPPNIIIYNEMRLLIKAMVEWCKETKQDPSFNEDIYGPSECNDDEEG